MRFAPIIIALVAVLAVGAAHADLEYATCQKECTSESFQSECAGFQAAISAATGRAATLVGCDGANCQAKVPGSCAGLPANITGLGYLDIQYHTKNMQTVTVPEAESCPAEKTFPTLHADDLVADFNISLAHNTDNGDGTSQICWNVQKLTNKTSTELKSFTIGICDEVAATITNLNGGFLEPNPRVRQFQGISWTFENAASQYCIELSKVYQTGDLTVAMQYKTGVTVIGSDISQIMTTGPRCCPNTYECVYDQFCNADTAESCSEWSEENQCAHGEKLIGPIFSTLCGTAASEPCAEICCEDVPSCAEFWSKTETPCPHGEKQIGDADLPCANDEECDALCCADFFSCDQYECAEGTASVFGDDPYGQMDAAGTRCDDGGDSPSCQSECCADIPSCNNFFESSECPEGQARDESAGPHTPCEGEGCIDTCCNDVPSCNNFFESNECPEGQARDESASEHTPCEGDACVDACCNDVPSCNNFFESNECPEGQARDESASEHTPCEGDACVDACCNDVPSCNNFFESHECPAGYTREESAGPHTPCEGEGCIEECCRDFYSCDQFSGQCKEGTRFVEREDNALFRCDDGSSSPACQDECCEDIHTCSDFSCPYPLVSISGTGLVECDPSVDGECVTLCCTEPECPVWWVDCGCTKVAPVKDDGKTVAIAFRSKEASHTPPRCEPSRDHDLSSSGDGHGDL